MSERRKIEDKDGMKRRNGQEKKQEKNGKQRVEE
jgi:hypothetical protein